MEPRDHLTNERLAKEYEDNFALSGYAIRYAQNEIAAGKEVHISSLVDRLRKDPHAEIVPYVPEEESEDRRF